MSVNPATDAAGDVSMTVENRIATVRFHHPKGNSLPGALLHRLAETITTASADTRAAVIVLRSDGIGPFCAGASFEELQAVSSPATGTEFFSGFARVILAMIRAPKFVVTRIQGRVAGGGVGLVAASDYALAVRAASAKLSELAIGIGPFVVGPCIEKKIGLAAFSAMAVDADWRDGEWCERHGLYAQLYPDVGAMDAALDARVATLSQSNPDAMQQLKRVFWAGTDSWDQLLLERARMSGTLVLSDFTRQAIANFQTR